MRGPPRHLTASKVMCWVAADRGARLAELRGETQRAAAWAAAAREIHAEVSERGVDGRGVFTQHYDTAALDASALLLPFVGFLPATDERIRRTVIAVADELTVHGLVLRYPPSDTDDGLTGDEGTFTICSFWLAAALADIGELTRGPGPVRTAAKRRQPAAAVCRGNRPAQRPPPRQLPAGLHPPGPDPRGDPPDPRGTKPQPARPAPAGPPTTPAADEPEQQTTGAGLDDASHLPVRRSPRYAQPRPSASVVGVIRDRKAP